MLNIDLQENLFSYKAQSFSLVSLVIPIGLIVFLLVFSFSYLFKQNVRKSPDLLTVSGAEPVQAQKRESKPSPNYLDEKQENKEKQVGYPKLKKGVTMKKDWKAESVLVRDHKTGEILLSKNADKKHPLASITKLMSSLVLLNTTDNWSNKIAVTSKNLPDSLVDSGEVYPKSQLWSAALVGSSNKSMASLVQSLDWPRQAFLQRMNKKAQELKMDQTYFKDVTGLDKESISTAKDISILLREAMKHKKIQKTLTTREINLKPMNEQDKHHIWNTNWLLLGWVPNKLGNIFGGKTGHIEAAGYNFTVQVSDQNGNTLDVVVLGADDHEARFEVARNVSRWTFDNYRWSN